MKRKFKYIFVGCIIFGISACQSRSDVPEMPSGEVQEEENVYLGMTVSFSNKIGTRVPDDIVTEPGKESEILVSEVLLVLADGNNKNVAAGILENVASIKGENRDYVIGIPFRLVKNRTGQTLNVYAFCNPTNELKSLAKNTPDGVLPEEFIDKAYTLTDFSNDPAWKPGHFFMSNARFYQTVLPENWSEYRSVSTPFPLLGENGKLEVERSVARFDYKTVREGNKYPVSSDKDDIEITDNPGIQIQLTDAAFINVSKSFYYLRRVGDEGITNIKYCGDETIENFVIDTDARYKMDFESWLSKEEYFYGNIEKPDSWTWDNLSSISENEEDNVWGEDDSSTQGYHIWRYITENTAPTVISQDRKISTGIVFKGKIIPGESCSEEMKAALEKAEEPIYVFDNKLYGTWSMAEKAGEGNEQLRVAWNSVENDNLSYEDAGFTVYKPVNGVYENYYFYWNIHNDNEIDDQTDENFLCPMKYAVVRNNVYKISVDAIFNFGYPDDYPSDKKDLSPRIMVSVKVVPWVERKYDLIIDE